jgi:hypothetical protein
MTYKFTVPNWGQDAIIRAAKLDLVAPAVTLDDDSDLIVMDLKTRKEYNINKKDGQVTVH